MRLTVAAGPSRLHSTDASVADGSPIVVGGSEPGSRPSLGSRVALTYAANLGVAALSFLNVLITARYLGPSGRGDVAFLSAIAMFSA